MQIRHRGFTLLEVMVVVAIVGIVAAIAMPSYQRYVIKEKRIDLQTGLIQIAQKLENYKLVNNDYGATNANTGYAGNALLNPAIYGSTVYPTTEKARYNLVITPAGGTTSAATSTTWEIDATPIGASAGDGLVKINDQNWRCWSKVNGPCTLSATSNWDTGP